MPHHGVCAQGGARGEALLEMLHQQVELLLHALALQEGCAQAPDLLIPGCSNALHGLDLAHQPGNASHQLLVLQAGVLHVCSASKGFLMV